jgi:hypothetical protein
MAQNFKDDRLTGDHSLYTELVGGRDTFMSGWGDAPGSSFAFWACRPADVKLVEAWVEGRGDISSVRVRHDAGACPVQLSKRDHCHIYPVGEGHPARERRQR